MSHLIPTAGQVASTTTSDIRDHEGALLPLLDPTMSFASSRKFKPHLSTG